MCRVFLQADEMGKPWEDHQQFGGKGRVGGRQRERTGGRVNKNKPQKSQQDMIETFFLKNIRYFTKSLNILHVSTKNRGCGGESFIYFSSQKYLLTLPLEFSFMWLRLSDYRGEEAGDTYSRPMSPSGTVRAGHTPSSQLTPLRKRPWRELRKIEREDYSLFINNTCHW